MSKRLIAMLACWWLLPGIACAHGGQYRGPAGGVPSVRGPGAGSVAGPTTGGSTGSDYLSKWQGWWEFNKDPYLRLKDALYDSGRITGSNEFFVGGQPGESVALKPSRADVHDRVLPALKRAMDETDQRDIVSSCMVAMAKAGINHDEFEILPIMKQALRRPDQEISETAALAMGISQMVDAVDDLISLVRDDHAGSQLVDRGEVNYRTQSFAAYALGLIGYSTADLEVKQKIYQALKELLEDKHIPNQDPRVAAINGMRLLRGASADPSDGESELVDKCIKTLWSYYGEALGRDEQLVQAHVPPAVAYLLGRGNPAAEEYKEAIARELSGRARRNILIYQAAPVALGLLCEPREKNPSDAVYSDLMLKYYKSGRDQKTRYLSLLALGKIGGKHNRDALLEAFIRGNQALEKPWAAMALGILSFHAARVEGAPQVDTELGRILHDQFNKSKNDDARAAIAIALGLAGYRTAAADILRALKEYKSRDELAGYLCIALSLMGATEAIEDIHAIVQESVRRPERLKQAAIALGKLGDKRAAETLQGMLSEGDSNLAKLSAIATALGFIGDRRSIEPLIEVLEDRAGAALSRAFAAVALGNVVDKELLPWSSKLAVDSNYSARVETLTNGVSGILDIL